jgi:outer membrane receptor for ferrienterochelin and colicin
LESTVTIIEPAAAPAQPTTSDETIEYQDNYASLWLNWAPSSSWAMSLEYSYNRYDVEKELRNSSSRILAPDGILKLETHKLPATISYFHSSGIIGKLTTTYYDQKGRFIDLTGINIEEGEEDGVITDITLSYRFPKRLGSVSLGIKNIFDKALNHEDRNSYDANSPKSTASPSSFSSERALFGKISVNFR